MPAFTKTVCKYIRLPDGCSRTGVYIFPKVESDAHILLQYRLNLLVMAGQYVFKNVVCDVVHS